MRSTSGNEGAGAFAVKPIGIGRAALMKKLPSLADWINKADNTIRIGRNDLVEEYRTSGNGIRQDFVINQKPKGIGRLLLDLTFEGAKVNTAGNCRRGEIMARLDCGRLLAYHSLNAIDDAGKKLQARFEITGDAAARIVVDDLNATYPVRIDPTITDADWVGTGQSIGIPYNGSVAASAIGKNGDLFVAGSFLTAGGITVNHIARWNGSQWSALGGGITDLDGAVASLVFDNSGNLYAAGEFDSAGDVAAKNIARWDGTTWSFLGSGTNGSVLSLNCDKKGFLHVGGTFSTAGGKTSLNYAICGLTGTGSANPVQGKKTASALSFDPKTGLMHVFHKSPACVALRLFSLSGREVFSASQKMAAGRHACRIPARGIARGTYIAHVKTGNESMRSRFTVGKCGY